MPKLSSWVVYWGDSRASAQAMTRFAPVAEEVCLFAYQFSADGQLIPASAKVTELEPPWRALPTRRLVTIVNDLRTPQGNQLKDPGCVHSVLSTPAARTAHIQQLLALAEPADGLDIDYERVAAEDGPSFTQFVNELASQLHARKKYLSIIVQPRTSDRFTASMLKNGTAAIDWAAVAQSADQIKVMAYLYRYGGSEPGSIAPLSWIQDIARYGLKTVPREKLNVILHLGGFDWPRGGTGKQTDFAEATALAAAHSVALRHDPASQSATFHYDDKGVAHEVWVEDAAGLQAKISALSALGVEHIGLWRLATGDPAFWQNVISADGSPASGRGG